MELLISQFGLQALTVVFSLVGVLALRALNAYVKSTYLRDVLVRAGAEAQAAVDEVAQVYVKEIKRANEDGVLTDEEKAKAKAMAVEIFKSNLGKKGLDRLIKVLGMDDLQSWISGKIESAVGKS